MKMLKRQPGFLSPGSKVQDDDEPTTAEVVAHPSIDQPTDRPIVNQCAAHRKNGDRCRKPSIRGATVCLAHGGGAPQVRRKAQVRLAMAADDLMRQLLKIALSSDDEGMRYRATVSALDRAGIGPKAELEVTHELKPYEQIFQDVVFTGLQRGAAPDAADADALDRYSSTERGSGDVIDAEVVEDDDPTEDAGRPFHLERTTARDLPSEMEPGPMELMEWDDPRAYGGSGGRRRGSRVSRRG